MIFEHPYSDTEVRFYLVDMCSTEIRNIIETQEAMTNEAFIIKQQNNISLIICVTRVPQSSAALKIHGVLQIKLSHRYYIM